VVSSRVGQTTFFISERTSRNVRTIAFSRGSFSILLATAIVVPYYPRRSGISRNPLPTLI
jgi:hypothetical protein